MDLAASEGVVWIAAWNLGGLGSSGVLQRTNAESMRSTGNLTVKGTAALAVAVTDQAVWFLAGRKGLLRVDPDTLRIEERISVPARSTDVVAGEGHVWTISNLGTAIQVEPESNKVVGPPIRVGGCPVVQQISNEGQRKCVQVRVRVTNETVP